MQVVFEPDYLNWDEIRSGKCGALYFDLFPITTCTRSIQMRSSMYSVVTLLRGRPLVLREEPKENKIKIYTKEEYFKQKLIHSHSTRILP